MVTAIWQQYLSEKNPTFEIANKTAFTVLPCFINNNHWALIIVDYCAKRFVLIDPMDLEENINQLQELAKRLYSNNKPVTEYVFHRVDHTIQRDSWTCGYFIMIVIIFSTSTNFVTYFFEKK